MYEQTKRQRRGVRVGSARLNRIRALNGPDAQTSSMTIGETDHLVRTGGYILFVTDSRYSLRVQYNVQSTKQPCSPCVGYPLLGIPRRTCSRTTLVETIHARADLCMTRFVPAFIPPSPSMFLLPLPAPTILSSPR